MSHVHKIQKLAGSLYENISEPKHKYSQSYLHRNVSSIATHYISGTHFGLLMFVNCIHHFVNLTEWAVVHKGSYQNIFPVFEMLLCFCCNNWQSYLSGTIFRIYRTLLPLLKKIWKCLQMNKHLLFFVKKESSIEKGLAVSIIHFFVLHFIFSTSTMLEK